MDAYQVNLNRSIDEMSPAQMQHALGLFEEKHENNLDYIRELRAEIEKLEEKVTELEEKADELDTDGGDFQKDSCTRVADSPAGFDMPGIKR